MHIRNDKFTEFRSILYATTVILRRYPCRELYSVDDSAFGEWSSGKDVEASGSDNDLEFAWKDWDETGKELY